MLVPIKNVGQYGVIQDTPAHELPANAWTDARNVRFYDNAVWRAYGQIIVLGTPTVDPYYLYHHLGPTTEFWAYPSLTTVYATDGTTHSNISRTVGGAYTGSADDIWRGTHLGGIEIFNNGVDVPQAWISPALGTPLVDLANWPANTTARVLKSFKQYLVAMDITLSGTRTPHLVKWSHVADPGSVPVSWDETDDTYDAGEYPLSASGGHILEAHPLQDSLMIYKEDQTHSMSYIGGRFVFRFQKRFNTGIVSPRCVKAWKDKHIVATVDDIIIHDGFQQESLLDDKMRRWYYGRADPDVRFRQYMVINARENEVWMCIPEAGEPHPSLALIINLKDGTQTVERLPLPTYIAEGPLDPYATVTAFDDVDTAFDDMIGTFGERSGRPGTDRLVAALRNNIARDDANNLIGRSFYIYDEGIDNYIYNACYVERLSMPISGVDRFGNPVLDPMTMKQVNEVWPEMRTSSSIWPVDIYVGAQDDLGDSISWEGPFEFYPTIDDKIDCFVVGRYISIRFESIVAAFKLDGYTLNVEQVGRHAQS